MKTNVYKRLSDINGFELIMGQSPSSSSYNTLGKGMPFLQGKADFGYIYPNPVNFTTEPIKIVNSNDILISVRAPVGDVNMAPYNLCIGRGLAALRFKNDIPLFYYYWFQFKKRSIENLGMGSTFKAITIDQVKNLEVPILSIEEQKTLSNVFFILDEAIIKADKIIERIEKFKESLMRRLLSEGINHKEYKELKLGKVPKEWKTTKTKDIFDVITGSTPSTSNSEYWISGNNVWITPTDLSNKQNDIYISESERKITGKAVLETSLFELSSNSIIISTRAPVGYVSILKSKAYINQGCKALIPKNNDLINSEFYYYYFLNIKQYLNSISGGSTFKELSKDSLSNIEIPLPDYSEQKKISEILISIDEKIRLERNRKNNYEKIKTGLMNDLLTGKKELK